MSVICPYCESEAEFISNEVVYGKPFGDSWMIYLCRNCEAYVGTHFNDPRKPLGTLAKRDLRRMRIKAHEHIDHLWRSGRYRRSTVYQALNYVFGREIHIGESDIETCRKILQLKWNADALVRTKGENNEISRER